MRTTLTLDPDVARMIEEESHRSRSPFKQVVNEALRRGLAPNQRRKPKKLDVVVHHARLAAGIDAAAFNRLADELEDASTVSKAVKG